MLFGSCEAGLVVARRYAFLACAGVATAACATAPPDATPTRPTYVERSGSEEPIGASIEATEAEEGSTTQWSVVTAPGLDAILMLGAASGDALQARYYAETVAFLRDRMPPEAVAAVDRLGAELRIERGQLVGPSLALVFSAGPIATIDDVLASARDPDRFLRAGLQQSANWSPDRYEAIRELMPAVVIALEGLKSIGFEAWYRGEVLPQIEEAAAASAAALAPYDIIPEHARLLGRPLDPGVEMILVRFAQPYGIRVSGQRFVAYYGYEPVRQLRVSAHEMFHPPFDPNDDGLLSRLEALRADPWMRSIVENHDPAYGYNSFESIVNEDSAQALDQIVSDRLGFGRDPAERWAQEDGGMHLLAAALYQAMKEDGFDARGGMYRDWLVGALDRGMLSASEVRRRAAIVVGDAAVQRWAEPIEQLR